MQAECELCGASFQQPQDLAEHMDASHTTAVSFEDALFECGDCQRSYPARDDLNLHVQRKHTA